MITPELIKYIISKKENYDIILPIFNGKYEPTCAVYNKNCISIIEKQILAKDYKLINFIEKSKTKLIEINEKSSFYKENLFLNLNKPKDLKHF